MYYASIVSILVTTLWSIKSAEPQRYGAVDEDKISGFLIQSYRHYLTQKRISNVVKSIVKLLLCRASLYSNKSMAYLPFYAHTSYLTHVRSRMRIGREPPSANIAAREGAMKQLTIAEVVAGVLTIVTVYPEQLQLLSKEPITGRLLVQLES